MKEFILFFKRAFDFKGRSTRKEYWIPLVILLILVAVFAFVFGIISGVSGWSMEEALTYYYVIVGIFSLLILIPDMSLTVRRLHDHNLSGWFYLLALIPGVAFIAMIVIGVLPTKEPNKYSA